MNAPDRPKDRLYEQLARIGKSVAAPKRLEILDLLAQAPRTVEELAGQAGLSHANTSRHLQVLRGARLVEARKRGLHVEYRLADAHVGSFLLALRGVAQARLTEIDRFVDESMAERGLPPSDRDALAKRVRTGKVTVLDVRPRPEFEAGHLPGALSIPLSELRGRLRELPRRREVVAYCRGRFCAMAADAVVLLRKSGFVAHVLDDGVLDWQARGFRLARAGAPT